MKTKLHFMVILLGTIAIIGNVACRKETDNVEAAREESAAAPDKATPLNQNDMNFAIDAETADIEEIALARLAHERSQNPDVKDYAEELVDEHSEALRKLVDLMDRKGIPQPTTLDQAREQAMEKLKDLSGAQFDQEFVNLMMNNHEMAVVKFQQAANTVQDPDLREYASDLLPTLQKHLKEAGELQNKLNTGGKG